MFLGNDMDIPKNNINNTINFLFNQPQDEPEVRETEVKEASTPNYFTGGSDVESRSAAVVPEVDPIKNAISQLRESYTSQFGTTSKAFLNSTSEIVQDEKEEPSIPENVPIFGAAKINPIQENKRLNTMDSHFMVEAEPKKITFGNTVSKNPFWSPDFQQLAQTFNSVAKKVLVKVPVVNYFVLKDKHKRLKQTVERLNTLNNDMDELLKSKMPYGEQYTIYKSLSESLMKANSIHSQILKEIGD